MLVICALGVSLIVYSRNEHLHPKTAAAVGPTASDHWYVAFGMDLCGTIEPSLPASANPAASGLRTFGNGLIDVDPSAAKTPADYEGTKATLGNFELGYSGLDLTGTTVGYPGKKQKIWLNGEKCGKTAALVQLEVWSSPSAKGHLFNLDPEAVHLSNGEMIMAAFLPKGAAIPEPPSKAALLTAIGSTTSTTAASNSTTSSTAASSTSTTVPKSKSKSTTTT
jgi:hypothetical protein